MDDDDIEILADILLYPGIKPGVPIEKAAGLLIEKDLRDMTLELIEMWTLQQPTERKPKHPILQRLFTGVDGVFMPKHGSEITSYEGKMLNDTPNGIGTVTFDDGRVSRGQFRAGFMEGVHLSFYPRLREVHQDDYIEGRPSGLFIERTHEYAQYGARGPEDESRGPFFFQNEFGDSFSIPKGNMWVDASICMSRDATADVVRIVRLPEMLTYRKVEPPDRSLMLREGYQSFAQKVVLSGLEMPEDSPQSEEGSVQSDE